MKRKVKSAWFIELNTLMGKCHLRRVHLLPANTDFYGELPDAIFSVTGQNG